QQQPIDRRQLQALDSQIRTRCRTFPIRFRSRNIRDLLFPAPGGHRINTDDGIFGGHVVVRQFDRPILAQHRLEAVHRRRPRHVLNIAYWLRQTPRNDCAVAELLQIPLARHTRLKKHTDRRRGIDQPGCCLLELGKSIDRNTALPEAIARAALPAVAGRLAERHRPGHPYGNRIPVLTGERKHKILQGRRAPTNPRPKVGAPLQGRFSTRYPAPSGVKRRVRWSRLNRLAFPSTPSSSVNTIRLPCVVTEPMECPCPGPYCAFSRLGWSIIRARNPTRTQ